jgi:putative glutamine amidotransferase
MNAAGANQSQVRMPKTWLLDGIPRIGIPCTAQDAANIVKGSPLEQCMDAIKVNGGEPVLLPVPDSYSGTLDPLHVPFPAAQASQIVDRMNALLIPGGPDIHPAFYGEENKGSRAGNPSLDAYEISLIKEAYKTGTPILGIGRGMQLMNVAAGGNLLQDIPSQVRLPYDIQQIHERQPGGNPATHPVFIAEEGLGRPSILRQLVNTTSLSTNSAHHQCIFSVPGTLAVVARATDTIIEAIESKQYPWQIGVQWHPEMYRDEAEARHDPIKDRIFKRLVLDAKGEHDTPVEGTLAARANKRRVVPEPKRHRPRTAAEQAAIDAMFPLSSKKT